MGLSFTIAAGPRYRSHSQVRGALPLHIAKFVSRDAIAIVFYVLTKTRVWCCVYT
jgi:hypothetical protein